MSRHEPQRLGWPVANRLVIDARSHAEAMRTVVEDVHFDRNTGLEAGFVISRSSSRTTGRSSVNQKRWRSF